MGRHGLYLVFRWSVRVFEVEMSDLLLAQWIQRRCRLCLRPVSYITNDMICYIPLASMAVVKISY